MLKYNKFETEFRGRGMSKQEMEEVFRTMDLNESGQVDSREQDHFQNFFISSFLACSSGQWRMSAANAKMCVTKEGWFNNLRLNLSNREEVSQAQHENDEEGADQITDIVHVADRNLDGTINLAEQLFLRKAGSAWRQCVTGDGMNYMELKCALSVISLHPVRINKGDARKVFLTAISWMMLNSKTLSQTVFFRVAQYQRSFSAQCRPTVDCVINRRELTNQIELQTAPTSLTPLEAKYVENQLNLLDLDVIDFPNFLIMSQWIDKFMMQAADDSLLSQPEFERMLADRSISYKFRATLDYSESDMDRSFLKITAKRAQEVAEGGGVNRSKKIDTKSENPITEDDQFSHLGFLQNKEPVYKGIKAKGAGKHPARVIVFNILDADQTGTVDIKEFFTLIKFQKVFAKLADGDVLQDPWKITMKTLKRNKSKIDSLQPGFPDAHAKSVIETLEKSQLNNQEINFKEFLIMMSVDSIFRRYCNNPSVPAGVPLMDLVTQLKRMDLPVVNYERFLNFTMEMPPLTPNQPALYNYLKAVQLLIMQEQFAILVKRQNDTKASIGADFSKLSDLEDKMFSKFSEKTDMIPESNNMPNIVAKEPVQQQKAEEKNETVTNKEVQSQASSVSSQEESSVKSNTLNEASSTQSAEEKHETVTNKEVQSQASSVSSQEESSVKSNTLNEASSTQSAEETSAVAVQKK